jgi:hypothetical protein
VPRTSTRIARLTPASLKKSLRRFAEESKSREAGVSSSEGTQDFLVSLEAAGPSSSQDILPQFAETVTPGAGGPSKRRRLLIQEEDEEEEEGQERGGLESETPTKILPARSIRCISAHLEDMTAAGAEILDFSGQIEDHGLSGDVDELTARLVAQARSVMVNGAALSAQATQVFSFLVLPPCRCFVLLKF